MKHKIKRRKINRFIASGIAIILLITNNSEAIRIRNKNFDLDEVDVTEYAQVLAT